MTQGLPTLGIPASDIANNRISLSRSRRFISDNPLFVALITFITFTFLSIASLNRFDNLAVRSSLLSVHAASKLRHLPLTATFRPSRRVTVTDGSRKSLPPDRKLCEGNDSCCRKVGGSKYKLHRVVEARLSTNTTWMMSTYMSGDIISNWVQQVGVWDLVKTQKIHSDLQSLGRDVVLLDIGANIGWFTLSAAYAGFHVIAIEPYERNLAHIQHSLCLAPAAVRNRVTVVHSGLGIRDRVSCSLMQSPNKNHGNTHTSCANTPYQIGYVKLGQVQLNRLDSLIAAGNISLSAGAKVVVKVDTEGYEPFAIMGGLRFFRQLRPHVVYSEFCPHLMVLAAQALGWSKEKASKLPNQYLETMKKLGYSFKNPNMNIVNQDIVFSRKQ